MLNQVVLVGRLANNIELSECHDTQKGTAILAIPRQFKNPDGIYETDFIKCIMYGNIAEHTLESCKKGDLIGVKGRLQIRYEDNKEYTDIIVEKVTFLSSKQKEEKEGE